MEFSQLILMLSLALGGGVPTGHTPADADARASVRADARPRPGEDGAQGPARPRSRATTRERLATGLVFGVAASPGAR
jgi:hypothetical protein